MTAVLAGLVVISFFGLIGSFAYSVCEMASSADDAMDRELHRECERRRH